MPICMMHSPSISISPPPIITRSFLHSSLHKIKCDIDMEKWNMNTCALPLPLLLSPLFFHFNSISSLEAFQCPAAVPPTHSFKIIICCMNMNYASFINVDLSFVHFLYKKEEGSCGGRRWNSLLIFPFPPPPTNLCYLMGHYVLKCTRALVNIVVFVCLRTSSFIKKIFHKFIEDCTSKSEYDEINSNRIRPISTGRTIICLKPFQRTKKSDSGWSRNRRHLGYKLEMPL